MDNTQVQKHTIDALQFVLSRMFERASFYGFRALLVLYMAGETLKMGSTEVLSLLGSMATAILISPVLGALIGDLIIGNRKSAVIGGIIQTAGVFTLCIPSAFGLYLGLFLVIIGNGLYTPNLLSNFGKLYLEKSKILDAGFAIQYFASNLGSFLGILIIGTLGEKYGYNTGFFISGLFMTTSLVSLIMTKENPANTGKISTLLFERKLLIVLIAFLIIGLFWGLYELINIKIYDSESQLSDMSALGIPQEMWTSISSFLIIPISLFAAILWTSFYTSSFFKLLTGFIFGLVACGLLFLVPDTPSEHHAITFLAVLMFFGFAEIHVSPISNSIVTRYSNPKYLAILISLTFIPTRLFTFLFGFFYDKVYENQLLGLKYGFFGMLVVATGLMAFLIWNKLFKEKTSNLP